MPSIPIQLLFLLKDPIDCFLSYQSCFIFLAARCLNSVKKLTKPIFFRLHDSTTGEEYLCYADHIHSTTVQLLVRGLQTFFSFSKKNIESGEKPSNRIRIERRGENDAKYPVGIHSSLSFLRVSTLCFLRLAHPRCRVACWLEFFEQALHINSELTMQCYYSAEDRKCQEERLVKEFSR